MIFDLFPGGRVGGVLVRAEVFFNYLLNNDFARKQYIYKVRFSICILLEDILEFLGV